MPEQLSVQFGICCLAMEQAFDNKVFSIVTPPIGALDTDGKQVEPFFCLFIGKENNAYNPETEEFTELHSVGKLNFCPFCGEECYYEIKNPEING